MAGLLSLWALFRGLPTARVYASSYAHAYTLQLVLGLLLLWQSSLLAPAYRNLALAWENPEVGFFLFEHWVGMFWPWALLTWPGWDRRRGGLFG
ncbi:MAG: hypothetical protein ACUVUP_02365 [Thermaceae bacterium]